jgi:hypothetical protein
MTKQFLFAFLLACALGTAQAQKITGVQFSYFVPATTENDRLGKNITVDGYTGRLENTNFVSENPKTRVQLIALIKKLKANGSQDISKCFIPRHCVTMVSSDSVAYHVLVCFECDGIRFGNERNTTKVKSVANREKWLKELKGYFTRAHFEEKR